MGYVEGNCPKCGKMIRERCNAWVYGSPIRQCPYCKYEFLDRRWKEVAIDGIDKKSSNPKFYLLATVGFIIFTIICVVSLVNMIKLQGHYPIKLIGCIIAGITGMVMSILLYLRNVTGYEDKKNEIYMDESKKRLQDRHYVEKLVAFGYDVPEEYLK